MSNTEPVHPAFNSVAFQEDARLLDRDVTFYSPSHIPLTMTGRQLLRLLDRGVAASFTEHEQTMIVNARIGEVVRDNWDQVKHVFGIANTVKDDEFEPLLALLRRAGGAR